MGGRQKTKKQPLHSAVIVHNKEYSHLNKGKRWYDDNPSNFKVLIMFSPFYFEGRKWNSFLIANGLQIRKIKITWPILFSYSFVSKSGEFIPDSGRSDREDKRPDFEFVLFINVLQDNFPIYFPLVVVLLPVKQILQRRNIKLPAYSSIFM